MRATVYCVVPRDLASLHTTLRRFFNDDPAVEVVIERRSAGRRTGEERRCVTASVATDRRSIQNVRGRRIGERRAPLVAIRSAPELRTLPRAARRHADRLMFVERLEPSTTEAEDVDTARLVTRFQAGEPEIFSTLYLRYFDRVYGYLNIAMKQAHEAEDATQQVFLKALEALPRYEERGQPLRAWLFTIARNVAIKQLEKQGRLDPVDPRELARRQENGGSDAADLQVLEWITDRELVMFVERLPLAQRQVLVLRYMLGLRGEEIATVLGRSVTDVRSLNHRALRFLRKRLAAVGRTSTSDRGIRMRRWLKPAPVLRERRFVLLK